MTAPTRMQQIEAMLRDDPKDPELHYMLAMEHASAGDDAAAVQQFAALIDLAPNYPPAYHMGARALVRLERIVEAKAMLQRGVVAAESVGNFHAAGEMQELMQNLDELRWAFHARGRHSDCFVYPDCARCPAARAPFSRAFAPAALLNPPVTPI